MGRGKGWRATAALEGLDASLGMGLIKGRTEGTEIRSWDTPLGHRVRKCPFFL